MPNTVSTPQATSVSTSTSDTLRGRGATSGRLDVGAVGPFLDLVRRGRVGEPGRRRAGRRVVVVAVPRAAQQAVLDRALAQRAALVRAVVVQRARPGRRIGSPRALRPSTTAVRTRPSSGTSSTRCQLGSSGPHPGIRDADELGDVALPAREVARGEVRQESWPQARASTTISSVIALQVAGQLLGRPLHGQPGAQVRLLGGDAHRAVVGVAGAHPDAADRLQGDVRHGDGVGAQRQRLDHVLRRGGGRRWRRG